MILQKLLCKIGIHKWRIGYRAKTRRCVFCLKFQRKCYDPMYGSFYWD